jgi:hypothetical protein
MNRKKRRIAAKVKRKARDLDAVVVIVTREPDPARPAGNVPVAPPGGINPQGGKR